MNSADLHQVVFKWPHTEPTTVIVTGTFDEWKSSIHLVKNPTGFEGVTQIPWEQKIKFKFIVDGEWLVHEDQPTEVDPGGFVNNIYTAPEKPVILLSLETTPLPVKAEKSTAVEVNIHRTNGDSVVAEAAESTPQSLPKHTKSLTGTTDGKIVGAELKTSDTHTSGFPQLFSDLASTIAARDGTSSALAYVASGLGAAMHSAVGIDPINIPKIPIPTPKYNEDFTLPPGMGTMSPTIMEESAPGLPASPIAPLVPIMIVPVNAAENNTVASSPPESMHILPRFAPEPSIPATTLPDTNDAPDMDAVTEKFAADTHTPVIVDALSGPEAAIKESATANIEVAPIPDVVPAVETKAPEEKANGPSPDPAVVNTLDIPESVVEESTAADAEVATVIPSGLEVPTERTIKSSPAPVIDTLPMPAPVIKESVSAEVEAIPVIPLESEVPAENFPEPSTRQPVDGTFSIAVHESRGQNQDSVIIPITPKLELDVTPALAIGSVETTLLPTDEAIAVSVRGLTSVDEVKPEENLSPESKAGSSDKKSVENVVVEAVVEPIPAIIGAPVDIAERETKSIGQVKLEDFSAPEPTETDPVLEEPLSQHAVAESVVEQTPIPVLEVPVDVIDVIELSVTEDYPAVIEPSVDATMNDDLPLLFGTATTPATTANVEAGPVSTSSVTPTVAEVPASGDLTPSLPVALVDEIAEVNPPTEPNLVTEEKMQTPISVKDVQTTPANPSSNEHTTKMPQTGELAEPSVNTPKSHGHAVNAAVVVAEPMPTPQTTEDSMSDTNGHFTPTVPTTPSKETPTTSSVKGVQEFPSSQTDSPSQTADNSPSSSKFNSMRKKRTSIFGKIKNIFHHDKEKEKK